jgi:hypothetical protein
MPFKKVKLSLEVKMTKEACDKYFSASEIEKINSGALAKEFFEEEKTKILSAEAHIEIIDED